MWDRWLDEIKAEAARRQQKRAERFADNIGIDQVKNLVKINRRYWWMDDQVKIGLARDGFGADDPQTEAVARESARTKRDWLVQYMPQSVRNALNSTSSNMLIGDSPVTLRQTREESSAPSSLFRGRENPGQAHTQDALDATDAVGEELFGSTWKFRGRQNSRPGAVQNALSSAASTIKEAHAQHEASLDRNVRDPRAGLVGQMNSTDEMIAAAKEVRAGDLSEEEFAMRFSLPYSATAKGKSLIGAPVWAGDELTPRGDPSSKVGTESGTWTERAYVAEMWQSLSNQEQINAGGYSDAQLDEITSQLRREDPDMWDMTRASGETMRMGTEPLSMTERFVDSAKTTGRIFFIAAESGLQMVDSSIRETGAAVKERDITRLPGVSGYEAAYKTAQEAKETGDYSAIPSMFGMAAFGEQNWRQSDAGVTIDMMTGNWNYVVYDTQQREALKVLIGADPSVLKQIEAIVHPQVAADRALFRETATADVLVFDIPLLFEAGGATEMDAIACVHVDTETQKVRVMARGTMSEAQFEQIRAKQMPIADKLAQSDYHIETDTLAHAEAQVTEILADIRGKQTHA